jgi:3-deoxy-7-phosphoheptulonate synthase
VVSHLLANQIGIMRGGAFKPRTSPYAFRGLGLEGLKLFHRIARENGIRIVSEVVSPAHIAEMYDHVDIFQVGTRNSQNFDLLGELGKVDKPVLLKRAMAGTLEELLQSAEYVFSSGNERLILCERGIRTTEPSYRNVLDLNAVPALKEKTHLPVIVDPSHGVGVRRWVEPLALAAIVAGADGIIYEVHQQPEAALSDGQQTLNFEESEQLIRKARAAFEFRNGR